MKPKNKNKLILIICFSLGLIMTGFIPGVEANKTLKIVMLGDSLTARFAWSEALPAVIVRNFGIDGDTTQNILNRLDPVIALKPDLIFLQVGINDFGHQKNKNAIMEGHRQIWDQLRQDLPQTKLVITSLLPVRIPAGENQDQNWNQVIGDFNTLLRVEAEKQGLSFIDLTPALSDGQNQLRQDFTIDGLHLLKPAYKIWVEALIPSIEKEKIRVQ